jgi:hypothetical protein
VIIKEIDNTKFLVDKYKDEPIVYICDAIGGVREIVTSLDSLEDEEKAVILSLVEKCQGFANKMEDRLIEHTGTLREEGFVKCSNCRTWTRITDSYDGLMHQCCNTRYEHNLF